MRTAQYTRAEKAIAAASAGGKSFDTTWYVEQERRIAEASKRNRVGEYTSLPGAPTTDYGYIYVIEFSTGVVKVGRTINPTQRLATHARAARVHGVDVRQSWISERHHGCDGTERKLIELCRRLGSQIDAEYFRGVAFEKALTFGQLLVEEATLKHLIASRTHEDSNRRAYLNQLIAAADFDMSMTWQEAHDRLGPEAPEGVLS